MVSAGIPDLFVSPGETSRLTIQILTLFPSLFDSWLRQGVVSRAIEAGIVDVRLVNLREFGVGRHHITDDYPFGGGAGMVMKPEPLFAAVESLQLSPGVPVILLTPRGTRLDQSAVERLSTFRQLVLVAGHYEGVDERVRQHLVTDELSIGDYVLSCGELAAMVVSDAVVRLVPGALAEGSTAEESFSGHILEYPQYTRPAVFRDWRVPEVLLSGHHGEIARWRRREALRKTFLSRPDLLELAELTKEERSLIDMWREEAEAQERERVDRRQP